MFTFVIQLYLMNKEYIKSLFSKHKENSLYHRYITNKNIEPLLNKFDGFFDIQTIGSSVLSQPIYSIKVGKGPKKILMWSQMHGNESTTTKAIFDLLNTFSDSESGLNHILEACTLYIIPILNPDGANAYTRLNANQIDLNRDAQALSQPESKILRQIFNEFKPNFCFNLHGQRTIFSVGNTNNSATVSFLAPAQDENCTITKNRKKAMEVIVAMNKALQDVIPNQIGIYDDAFNINCVGDTFQSQNTPTILFEAGHYSNDYAREVTRGFIYMSLITSLDYISNNDVKGEKDEFYIAIPENGKCFYDIIIRNVEIGENRVEDIGIMYQEKLIYGEVKFIPKIEKVEILKGFYGHKELNANSEKVFDENGKSLKVDSEINLVMMNNEKISLLFD